MALLTEHVEQDSLGGGRYRQTIALKRIARRVDGNLVRLLNRVGATGDPSLPMGVSELFDFRLRDRLSGNAPVLHVGKGQQQLRLTPLDTNSVNGQVFGENGYGYRYPGAWNGADLQLQVGGHIIRKTIPLRTGHPGRFQFRLDSFQDFDPPTLSGSEFRIVQPSLEGPEGQHIPLVWAVSEIGGHQVLTVELPPGDWAGWLVDPTVTVQPDATDGVDTLLAQESPYDTWNFGISNAISVGDGASFGIRRGLLKFPLTTVPDTFSSAVLSVMPIADNAANAFTLAVYRQKRAWLEGTRDGPADSPATGATWNRYDLTNNWATAGGFGADDCEQSSIGTLALTAAEALNVFKSISLTPTTLADLDLGNGWMLKTVEENADEYDYASSDHATAANRPTLVVEYSEAAAGNPHYYYQMLARRRAA